MRLPKFSFLLLCLFLTCCFSSRVWAQQPMSCQIQGRLIKKWYSKDAGAHVIAQVLLLSANNCGSAVTSSHNPGDTIMVHFQTKSLSLKIPKNAVFTAQAFQHLKPGTNGDWWVNDFTLNAKPPRISQKHK